MALPSNQGTGTVKGKFIDGAGNPIAGKLTFKASPQKILDPSASPDPVTILPKPVTVTLDSSGAFSQVLLATDDTDNLPVDWTWEVSFALIGSVLSPFDFELPQGTTVDLAVVAPMSAAGGKVIVQGIPTGGTAGQILAKKSGSNYDTKWINPPVGGGGGGSTLSTIPAGSVIAVYWDGASWKYAGGTVTARPTNRADVTVDFIDPLGTATPPAWALVGDLFDQVTP